MQPPENLRRRVHDLTTVPEMIPTNDPGQWAKLCAAFDALVGLDESARAERLDVIGDSDLEYRRALEELLEADANAASWLHRIDAVFGTAAPPGEPPANAFGDPLKLVGRIIGHFRVLEPLATGGMGAVYRGLDTHLDRPVALKFPLPGQRLDHRVRERFLREARAAGALDHPNICSIYQAGETEDGQLFLAMPLYQGETLKARIAREGRLPIADVISIAQQLAGGLHAAHGAGITHRDLKPANVILLPDGGVRILDFGIARMSDATLTAAHGMLGTVPYMAPEQVRGEKVDARVDLWALGVLLYEMLTGRRPFDGEHEIAIAHAIVHSDPAPPSALRPEISPELDALVMGLLTREPGRRPASAEAVVTALAALESGSAQRRVRRQPRVTRPAARTLSWTATVALLLTAGGTTAWLLGTRGGAGRAEPRVVAVLPFEELGGSDDYLALALADETASQLSGLKAVVVPTALPALGHRDAGITPLTEIGVELGAAALVRGSVRREGDQVQLGIELFDVRRNRSVLQKDFHGPAATLPALQRDAKEAIIRALGLRVTSGERAMLRRLPTEHPEAYDLYLRGRATQSGAASGQYASGRSSRHDPRYQDLERPAVESLQRAESFFARARELDPAFAAARARLAMAHLALAPYGQTEARRDQGRFEAEAALRLQPGIPEGHDALASYWMLLGERLNAIGELERTLARRPNAPVLYFLLGINLRQAGRWEEAVAAFERASELDPLNTPVRTQAALTYSRLRRYEEAIAHWDRVIALDAAGDPFPQIVRGLNYLRLGDVDSLDAAISRIPLAPDAAGMTTYARYTVHRIRGRHAELLASLDSARFPISGDALIFLPVSLMRAQTLERIGDTTGARANYEAARSLLEDSVLARPQDPRMRVALGLAYAGLDRRVDAMREARTTMEFVPVADNSPAATAFMGGALEIYARLGEADAAFELIELLLAMPAGRELSVPLLRIDPIYEPLRSDPRFAALIARYSPN
jgi:eukaryotic-like serine/threonine-protein kinase